MCSFRMLGSLHGESCQIKVAGQNPEVLTGIEIETRRNPSKPIETCHRNPSKPVKIERFRLLPKWD